MFAGDIRTLMTVRISCYFDFPIRQLSLCSLKKKLPGDDTECNEEELDVLIVLDRHTLLLWHRT